MMSNICIQRQSFCRKLLNSLNRAAFYTEHAFGNEARPNADRRRKCCGETPREAARPPKRSSGPRFFWGRRRQLRQPDCRTHVSEPPESRRPAPRSGSRPCAFLFLIARSVEPERSESADYLRSSGSAGMPNHFSWSLSNVPSAFRAFRASLICCWSFVFFLCTTMAK